MRVAAKLWCCLIYLACSVSAQADWQPIQRVDTVRILANGVELSCGSARVNVVALSPTVVRLRYSPSGSVQDRHTVAVLPDAFPNAVKVQVRDAGAFVNLDTGALQVRILKFPLRVVFLDPHGQVILQDQSGSPVAFNHGSFRVSKTMPQDEHYFGLGDKAGPLDLRDRAFTMWNTDAFGWVGGSDPLYKSIPFFLGLRAGKAYGVYLDNTFRSTFDFGKESRDFFSFGADGGDLDYYFFYGPDPKAVLASFTQLIGRTPLPPLFELAYQQSRYSYFPEARVREVARTFREHKIPCDVLYLDIDYQDQNRVFTVGRQRFPNFEGMIHDLLADGFKTVVITDLHIKKEVGYKPYDEGMKGDYFVKNPDGSVYVGPVWPGDSVFPDFTREAVRRWWGTLYTDFVRMGIRGFWNDMNEPAVFRYPEKTMPLDTVHHFDDGRAADHREVHNIYGMENVHGTHDGLLQLKPNQRPFVLTRAAFAGTQRYAATWTGDNQATWEHYRLSITGLLSMGISGYPLVGADVGGFDGSPTPELLTRWTELGAFQPFFRNHSAKGTRDREPWVDGPEHEAIRRRYIEERYRLLPYIYTSMKDTSRTGIPLMRPLFLDFPDVSDLQGNYREFMFGPDLLVAPKFDETVDSYEVKLPPGMWYDYWTGAVAEGKPRVTPALDQVPVYVRAGSIVPRQPVVQNVEQTPTGPLELMVYPGPNCHGSIYYDDGNTLNYTRGELLRQQMSCTVSQGSVEMQISPLEGNYHGWWKDYRVVVFGIPQAPAGVTVGGKPTTDWKFDSASKSVSLSLPASSRGIDIRLSY